MDDLTQREFQVELEELTEQLFAVSADLRRQEASAPLQREILTRTFRCLHSIKGVASAAGFTAVAELAHQTETVLDLACTGRIKINDPFVDTLEDVANTIAESLGEVSSGKSERATDLLGQRLSALATGAVNTSAARRPTDLPAGLADSLNEREKQLVVSALRGSANVCLIDANFDLAVFDTQFQKLRETLTQYGAVICTLPSAAGAAADRIGFRLFYTSEFDASAVQTRLLAAHPEAIVTDLSRALPVDPNVEQPGPVSSISASPTSASPSFIRVELDDLDRLQASARAVFEQLLTALDLVSTRLGGAAMAEFSKLDGQVRQSLTALAEQIVGLRTIPVGRVIQRATRAGQVAARIAGKEVEFTIEGADLRIDKEICDAIATPLIHLIRNAVDHGIESPAERTNAGKSRTGLVRIQASAAASEICFLVSDDGRGINPELISSAAATRGLIEKNTVLDLDQSLRLIFRPGFSTAATVSKLSGRGVGLDVVEHSLAEISGTVSVRSWPGKGSEFALRLPRNQLQLI